MHNEPKLSYTFLLRLWPATPGRTAPDGWRATLENARTGERLGFAGLEQLFAHLLQLAESSGDDRGEGTVARIEP